MPYINLDQVKEVFAKDDAQLCRETIAKLMKELHGDEKIMESFGYKVYMLEANQFGISVRYVFKDRPGAERQELTFQIVGIKSSMPRPGDDHWDGYHRRNKSSIDLLGRRRLDELERFMVRAIREYPPANSMMEPCYSTVKIANQWYCLLVVSNTHGSVQSKEFLLGIKDTQYKLHMMFNNTGTAAHEPGYLNLKEITILNSRFIETLRMRHRKR